MIATALISAATLAQAYTCDASAPSTVAVNRVARPFYAFGGYQHSSFTIETIGEVIRVTAVSSGNQEGIEEFKRVELQKNEVYYSRKGFWFFAGSLQPALMSFKRHSDGNAQFMISSPSFVVQKGGPDDTGGEPAPAMLTVIGSCVLQGKTK